MSRDYPPGKSGHTPKYDSRCSFGAHRNFIEVVPAHDTIDERFRLL